jgi:hypothetical protein
VDIMTGLSIIIPRATAPENPGPADLHDAGVTWWTHRYVASEIAGTAGTDVATWEDRVGDLDLTGSLGGGTIKLADQDSIRAVRIISATTGSATLRATSPSRPGTIAAIIRITDTTVVALRALGYYIQRASSGNVVTLNGGTSGFNSIGTSTGIPAIPGWLCIVATLENDGGLLAVNGRETTKGAQVVNSDGLFGVQATAKSGAAITLDVAEFLHGPNIATAGERAAIYADLKTHYGAAII